MKKLVLLINILLLLSGCSYYNTDEYLVDHSPGPLPSLSLVTSFDTLPHPVFVADSILFEYEISLDSGRVYFSYFEFQQSEGYVSDTNAASLWIRPDTNYTGTFYDLNMTIGYKTNSGSLADLINAEYALLDTSWTLQVKEELE